MKTKFKNIGRFIVNNMIAFSAGLMLFVGVMAVLAAGDTFCNEYTETCNSQTHVYTAGTSLTAAEYSDLVNSGTLFVKEGDNVKLDITTGNLIIPGDICDNDQACTTPGESGLWIEEEEGYVHPKTDTNNVSTSGQFHSTAGIQIGEFGEPNFSVDNTGNVLVKSNTPNGTICTYAADDKKACLGNDGIWATGNILASDTGSSIVSNGKLVAGQTSVPTGDEKLYVNGGAKIDGNLEVTGDINISCSCGDCWNIQCINNYYNMCTPDGWKDIGRYCESP